MAADVSAIVGIVLMSIGGVFIIGGLVLCYFTKVKNIIRSTYKF